MASDSTFAMEAADKAFAKLALITGGAGREPSWITLALAGIEANRANLDSDGYRAASDLCRILAQEAERLDLTREV